MKVFIIPFPEQFNFYYFCPRGHEIVLRGLKENGVELVNHPDEADYIFLTYVPHHAKIKWDTTDIDKYDSNKLVIIDWIDEYDRLLYPKFHRYFKRSCYKPLNSTSGIVQTKVPFGHKNILPIAYCAMKEFFRPEMEKVIDIGCYLRPTCPNRIFTLSSVAHVIQNSACSFAYGQVSDGSRSIENKLHFDEKYLNTLAATKILVTCQPTHWEGDSRLWEALANGCCVVTDKIFTDYPGKPIDGEHLFEFEVDGTEALVYKLNFLLKNMKLAQEISVKGKDWVVQYNMETHRMKYVLENL